MEFALSYELIAAFVSLTILEIVLGIDNIIFITIITNRLPVAQRRTGRLFGLGLAMVARILLLLTLSWMMGLTATLFTAFDYEISGRDMILFAGGLFLVYKAVIEIHNSLGLAEDDERRDLTVSFGWMMVQIALIDMVFSLDSVITAVGLVDQVEVMVAAIVCAVITMMIAATPLSNFVEANPAVKMLALAFLLVIGFTLVLEAVGVHIPKGYIYVSMGFSSAVIVLNIWRTKRASITLRKAQFHDLFPRTAETG